MRTKSAISSTVAPESGAGFRRFLYVSSAITGASILIIEILGAKMLAPYIGTSHFVWTAQIAVTLVALAMGYWLGGWLVDRGPSLGRLYGCIAGAAVYVCVAVAAREPVAYWCLQFKLAAGALLAAALLFLVPLTLLATTIPFLVRVLTQSGTDVGGVVGRLSAVSTLGSVAGTVLIGYLLIPFFRNSVTMLGTAGVLLLLSGAYFVFWRKDATWTPVLVVGAVAGLGLGGVSSWRERHAGFPGYHEVFSANSNFGVVQVLDRPGSGHRLYLNDYLVQNTYDPATRKSLSMFTDMLHLLARAYTPEVQDVLCIGMGVGIVPMQFAREGASVDVVEINPAVVPVATRWFGLEPERLHITIDDGRYFLNRSRRLYDVIVLDAFLGDSSPSHLMTREAFAAMQRRLKPGGTLVMNSFGDIRGRESFFTASIEQTLRTVFPGVRMHATGNGNVFFAAGDRAELAFVRQPGLDAVHASLRSQVEHGMSRVVEPEPGRGQVLWDDFNPAEYHDARNREHIRRQLALSLKGR
jgi:spermidine synthase